MSSESGGTILNAVLVKCNLYNFVIGAFYYSLNPNNDYKIIIINISRFYLSKFITNFSFNYITYVVLSQ